MTEFQRRLEANIRESLRFAVGEVQDDAVAHMVAGVNAVLNHPSAPPPQEHMEGRWRVIEAATARGYWGIELEDAGNDDDAIMYPQKIHRDTVARIVEAHNAALATTEGSTE